MSPALGLQRFQNIKWQLSSKIHMNHSVVMFAGQRDIIKTEWSASDYSLQYPAHVLKEASNENEENHQLREFL